MAVEVNQTGVRAVRVEVEVPAAADDAWQAVATADGISAWFVPTTFETDATGRPTQVTSDFGPGMVSVSEVTAWDPPRSFEASSRDLGPDAPAVISRWSVEPREGDRTLVRVEHAIETDQDTWDASLEAWESGWPGFFQILGLYLAHFAGERAASFQLSGFSTEGKEAAWAQLLAGLGIESFEAGEPLASSGAAPSMQGVAQPQADPTYPEELLVHLAAPAPGIAHLFALPMGDRTLVSVRLFLFGRGEARLDDAIESEWRAWLETVFPASAAPVGADG